MSYADFCSKYKPTKKQLFTLFYSQFEHEFSVKNQRLAIEKLAKIITATFKLSHNQSFATMSLRQLSEETGLSMGGLYAYIQSKQQLALMIHRFLNQFCMDIILKVEKQSKQEPLETLIKAHVYLSEFMQPWFFFAFMESKNLDKKHRAYATQTELSVESKLAKIIKFGQQTGVYHNRITAEQVAAMIKPLLHDWYLKRGKYKSRDISVDAYCTDILSFINSGVRS
jgi:AcrR family transcriptional regulator